MSEQVKHSVDATAAAITAMSLFEVIPAVVSVLTGIWVCIRIYETDTVQKLLGRKIDEDQGGG